MKISAQLTEQDYMRAQTLHMKPRRAFVILGYVISIPFAVMVLYYIVQGLRGGHWPNGLGVALFLVVYFFAIFFVILPWRRKRLFRQHKALQRPYSLEFSAEGVIGESASSRGHTPWADYRKWKADQCTVLLYHTDAMFQMVPLRVLGSEAECDELLGLIEKHLGKPRV